MRSAKVNAERDAIAARALAAAAAGKACAADAPDPQGEAMDEKMTRWASHYGSFDRRVVQGLICVAAELTVLDAGTVTKQTLQTQQHVCGMLCALEHAVPG